MSWWVERLDTSDSELDFRVLGITHNFIILPVHVSNEVSMSHATPTAQQHIEPTESAWVRWLFGFAGIVAFIGWLDTNFLVGVHLEILPLPEGAPIAGTQWAVITSDWSYLFGIPSAMLGAVYYLFVLALVVTWVTYRLPQIERLLLPVTAIGIVMSAIFVSLMLFVIEAICPLCMVSATTSTLLFLSAAAIYWQSDAPPLTELGTDGIDVRTLVWPVMLFVTGVAALAMYHLVGVLPLPVPGA